MGIYNVKAKYAYSVNGGRVKLFNLELRHILWRKMAVSHGIVTANSMYDIHSFIL